MTSMNQLKMSSLHCALGSFVLSVLQQVYFCLSMQKALIHFVAEYNSERMIWNVIVSTFY